MKLVQLIESTLTEYKLDNENGLGVVGNNTGENPDYFGIRVMMTPSKFLKLASPIGSETSENFRELVNKIADGVPIASPFLTITIPNAWEDTPPNFHSQARVNGHEGRHRMMAVQEVDGDVPVEVHISGRFETAEMRRRHLTDEMIEQLLGGLINQKGDAYIPDIGTEK